MSSSDAEAQPLNPRGGSNRAYSLDQQGVEIESGSEIWKSSFLKNSPGLTISQCFYTKAGNKAIETLHDVFERGKEISLGTGDCLGVRRDEKSPYRFLSYDEVDEKSKRLAAGLGQIVDPLSHRNNLKNESDENFNVRRKPKIGIMSSNRPEFFMTCLACVQQNYVLVPISSRFYSTMQYIISKCELNLIIAEKASDVERLLLGMKGDCEDRRKAGISKEIPKITGLKNIIIINAEDITGQIRDMASKSDVTLHIFDDILSKGRKILENRSQPPPVQVNPDDVYIICFTSGTTGLPKGVQITHRGIIMSISAAATIIQNRMPKLLMRGSEKVHFSFVPMAHMSEQIGSWDAIMAGGKIGYIKSPFEKMHEDMRILHPTTFFGPPIMLQAMKNNAENPSNSRERILSLLLYSHKSGRCGNLLQRIAAKLIDFIFLRLFRLGFGGRIRMISTGSTTLHADTLSFARYLFGCPIIQGYGQTEATSLISMTWPDDDISSDHVGGPAPCCIVKLEDVPEYDMRAANGIGQLLVKGPSITRGYYDEDRLTRKLFTKDGFLRTGDIATIDQNDGTIRIVERLKDLFKIATGRYVPPFYYEQYFSRCPIVSEIIIEGRKTERHLCAIVVPKTDQAADFVLRELIRFEMADVSRGEDDPKVRAIVLLHQPLLKFEGLLTETRKIKRLAARQMFEKQIDNAYERQLPAVIDDL
ncbi:hypothetical protein WR25_24941 isoform B [Diploscapter pachys]|uniref:long-chain-fatty-acid--CoA ligase n=1 Tax=Diploscapter pachys TaxID=2018661 RepID=A0A2A2J2N7_9BILA|nr:hypothetical protein WR25_24941 isoform B [Diploscapter pachys]